MRLVGFIAVLFSSLFLDPACAGAVGFAHSHNFVVLTPANVNDDESQALADRVLAKAEAYRRQIATEWLGEELPPGAGRTVINVEFSERGDAGGTWEKDHPARTHHKVFLWTSQQRAPGDTLKHEIAHVVLSTRYPHPNSLPIWLEEGIASRYDDAKRQRKRQQTLNGLVEKNKVPGLHHIFDLDRFSSQSVTSYSIAVSLTDYLVELGDKQTLLHFAQDGQRNGWNQALWNNYRIRSTRDLQIAWQTHLGRTNQLVLKTNSFASRTAKSIR